MGKVEFGHGGKVAMLAAGQVQDSTPGGKRRAVGAVNFGGQPTAADTVTINGTVFTARASGAAGNEFNIGVDLTTTISNLATVLNASAVVGVAKATYSNSGGTALRVVFDAYGTAGNAFTLAENGSNTTVSGATLSGGTDADRITLASETHVLTTAAGEAQEWDLPAGSEGQETAFLLKTKGTGANAIVNGTFAGGTAITLDTVGEWFKAKFIAGSWRVIVNTGVLA